MFRRVFKPWSQVKAMAKQRIGYEAVEGPGGEFSAIVLKIDGHEFTLDKTDVGHLGGIVTAVYDWMVDPFDAYLMEGASIRLAGPPGSG